MNQYSKISNPSLVSKMKQFKNKSTNYIVSKYLELSIQEKHLYNKMHVDHHINQIDDSNLLKPGAFINECNLIYQNDNYLKNYRLELSPNGNGPPVIGVIS